MFNVGGATDTTADGAGITIKGASDKTLNWVSSTGRFTSNQPFEATSIQNTPIGSTTASSGAFSSLTVTGTSILQNTQEKYTTVTGVTAGATVAYNWASSATFYHASVGGNYNVNFTNVPTTDGYAYNIVLMIIQGAAAYIPTVTQVNSATTGVTFSWANNTAPTGVANRPQVFSFSVLRVGTTWRIIGTAQAY